MDDAGLRPPYDVADGSRHQSDAVDDPIDDHAIKPLLPLPDPPAAQAGRVHRAVNDPAIEPGEPCGCIEERADDPALVRLIDIVLVRGQTTQLRPEGTQDGRDEYPPLETDRT